MQQHIMVVDDEAVVRKALSDYLKLNGYRVSATIDSRLVLDMVEKDPPDLLIVDLLMPEVDGLVILEGVKKRFSKVPVLILTGMGYDNPVMEEALKMGADGFLSKCLSFSHLVLEIRRVLRNEKDHGPNLNHPS